MSDDDFDIFPDCKPSTHKKYLTRNSPPYPAQSCPGVILEGKDGKYISKADKNGNYKWVIINKIKKSPIKMKTPSPMKMKTPSPMKMKTPSPMKMKTPSPMKMNTPSPMKMNTPSPMNDNVLNVLKSIKPHLSVIKGLIESIKPGDIIKRSKTEKLAELNNNMTIFTQNFIDSVKIQNSPIIKIQNSPIIKMKIKECPDAKVLNPKTNRCVDKKSKIGKMLI
jgi:hypothetical protein